MGRLLRDGVVSMTCLAAVLAGLVLFDARVRAHVALLIRDVSGEGVTSWEHRLHVLGSVVADAVHQQSLDHGPLLIFTVVSALLVAFMLRT